MNFPDWLLPTFLLLPALLWMFVGVGLPWALAILPRSDWHQRVTVLAVSMALGPAFLTLIMVIIGTYNHFSVANVMIGSVIVAAVGVIFALRNHARYAAPTLSRNPLSSIEVALIIIIAIAVILRFWNTAYWPFATYDEFWVYGYNAKLFMLRGAIPSTLGYYPQLLPLSYTYTQLVWGGLNDHAARTVVPYFALASILMAYMLGAKLFNRRIGLLTAAIWALYPHHAVWSQFGDLEVSVTLYFTATATFFMLGWRDRQRRYVMLSGLLMGAALWTKPTAAALVESLVLIIVAAFTYQLVNRHANSSSGVRIIRDAGLALIVAVPMGSMWYVRNILYGLPPLVFPAGYWQTQAQRSGQELGWLLLIAATALLLLIVRRERIAAALGGFTLLSIGSLPSAFGGRLPTISEITQALSGQIVSTITPTRLTVLDLAFIVGGATLLLWAAYPLWQRLPAASKGIGWLLTAFIVPYFVTWFWSYSYHFRLSFAIVPLLIVISAVLLDATACHFSARLSLARLPLRTALLLLIIALALPGIIAVPSGLQPALTGSLPNDDAKMAYGNPALLDLVHFLQQARDQKGRPLKVAAPGELRLPFFFPLDDIHTDSYPTLLDQIADVDYFVDSSVAQRLYNEQGKLYNQVLASLTRDSVLQRVFTKDDKNFRFSVYTVTNAQRFVEPTPGAPLTVQIGDFAALRGWDIGNLATGPGEAVVLTLWWKALKPADLDYSVFIHLWDAKNQKLIAQWGGQPVEGAWSVWQNVAGAHFNVPYHTRLWQSGEIVKDEWRLVIPKEAPPGSYELLIGLYDPISNQRLPISQDGTNIGDSLLLKLFTVL